MLRVARALFTAEAQRTQRERRELATRLFSLSSSLRSLRVLCASAVNP
jgi:hypothetical protein